MFFNTLSQCKRLLELEVFSWPLEDGQTPSIDLLQQSREACPSLRTVVIHRAGSGFDTRWIWERGLKNFESRSSKGGSRFFILWERKIAALLDN
jgi:hypothetical protein